MELNNLITIYKYNALIIYYNMFSKSEKDIRNEKI